LNDSRNKLERIEDQEISRHKNLKNINVLSAGLSPQVQRSLALNNTFTKGFSNNKLTFYQRNKSSLLDEK
jgi:hypothetical protein